MITRPLLWDSLREIGRYPARFLSILAIVAIGAAMFAGMKAVGPAMKHTADLYYDRQNMMDIRALSTLGLDEEDIRAVEAVDGVETVQAGYFTDVVTIRDASEYVLRVHSLPEEAQDGEEYLNMPRLVEGRLPSGPGEAVVELNRNVDFPIELGSSITVASGKAEDISSTLAHSEYTVVGRVVSPYYLTYQREPTDIGSGRVHLFMMVDESEFLYPVYTEALVTVEGAEGLSSYSAEYRDAVKRVTTRLQNVGEERAELRLAGIQTAAQAELDAATAELGTRQAEYDQGIASGEEQLNAAENQLVAGRATLASKRESTAQQLAVGQEAIAQQENQLNQSDAQYKAAVAQYSDTLQTAEELLAQADSAIALLDEATSTAEDQELELDELINAENLTDEQREQLQGLQDQTGDIQAYATTAIDEVTAMVGSASEDVSAAKAQMASFERQLATARAQLGAAKRELAAAEAQATAEFAAAEEQLASGQAQLDAGRSELAARKAEGATALEDGRRQLADAEDELARVSAPVWYVLDRDKLYSYADFAATADRMDAMAALFPVFLFAVAALVCLTTMTRMVDEQRTAIGTYKALGYRQSSIAFKYVFYAGIASALGGVLGVIVGMRVFPEVLFNAWKMLYELPPMERVSQVALPVATVVVSMVLIIATAWFSVRQELSAVPAALMRPKAPRAGKTILLERIPVLWRMLSFSQKVTMRNLFRYRKRFFMTVAGVTGCAALLIAGLGLSDSIKSMVTTQYGDIMRMDMEVRMEPASATADRHAVFADLRRDDDVESLLPIAQVNATVQSENGEITAPMITPLEPERLANHIVLRSPGTEEAIALPRSGAVITEQMAQRLGVVLGDSISVDRGTGVFRTVSVAGIAENYIFHYVYLSPDAYEEVFRQAPEPSGAFVTFASDDKATETAFGSSLIDRPEVASVTYVSDAIEQSAETVKTLDSVTLSMIISAGLLAFVVLYNLTIINLSERTREVATIKVLGFRRWEVSTYVYRENLMLTVIGGILGLLAGIGLHRLMIRGIGNEDMMFGTFISGRSFAEAFGITLLFGIVVSFLTYPKLMGVKMVESLKSIE